MAEYNVQYFDAEQVKSGEMEKFLNLLLSEAYGAGKHFNDVHITPTDAGGFAVEWIQNFWDHTGMNGTFGYVGPDEIVAVECEFPDGHYELFATREDFDVALGKWIQEHPTWKKGAYGGWYDESMNLTDQFTEPAEHHYENGIPQGK